MDLATFARVQLESIKQTLMQQFGIQEQFFKTVGTETLCLNWPAFQQPVYVCSLEALRHGSEQIEDGFIIWEDDWAKRKAIVLSRLESLKGETQRIHGRSTRIEDVDQPTARDFLEQNHLKGAVKAKHRIGLYQGSTLVALGCFSKGKTVTRSNGAHYRSFELSRFCNKLHHTVIGGFTKVLKHFIRAEQPDDIMTYAETTLTDGHSFEKMGFVDEGTTAPIHFRWDPTENKRIYPNRNERNTLTQKQLDQLYPLQLPGNRKFILYLKEAPGK